MDWYILSQSEMGEQTLTNLIHFGIPGYKIYGGISPSLSKYLFDLIVRNIELEIFLRVWKNGAKKMEHEKFFEKKIGFLTWNNT